MSPVPSPAERRSAGEAARSRVPIASLGSWTPAPARADPVALLLGQAATRVPDLVPIRHGRMAVSPIAYYRGAALPMAADLAPLPTTGIVVQLCGDAHLSNFGLFASPERELVFDVTDFDETLPGPFEWDVRRLASSILVAGRFRGFDEEASRHAVRRTVRAYVERMAAYASMRAIDVYYDRVDVAAATADVDKRDRPFLESAIRSAAHHDAIHELPKLTEVDSDGQRRIVDHPPFIRHDPALTPDITGGALARYRDSLQEDRRVLLDRYAVVDAAIKVVGIGSVGLYALAVLFLAADDDPLLLQVKQAEASVLEQFLPFRPAPTPGARVVTGQRRLQATSDVLLGWMTGAEGRHWYVRQLQDQKGAAVLETMAAEDLATWGELCGWALARGHARSGQPAEIAGYLGTDKAFEHAMETFATGYADQNQRDYDAFLAAIRDGRVTAEAGL